MATGTKKSSVVTVIAPSAPVATVVEPQESKIAKRKRNRKALYTGGRADGKPARGLQGTPEGYVDAKTNGRLVRGQFKSAAIWYAHCAEMARREVEKYTALSADALANPAKYQKERVGVVKAELVAQISKLEALLISKGFSAEDIAAMCKE
jgi:hypothetical protein